MSLNREQMLFLVGSEEASEVAKELVKCIRFTPNHTHHAYDASNYQRFLKEFNELLGMVDLIREHMRSEHFVLEDPIQEGLWRNAKKAQFEHYGELSAKMGVCEEGACEDR